MACIKRIVGEGAVEEYLEELQNIVEYCAQA